MDVDQNFSKYVRVKKFDIWRHLKYHFGFFCKGACRNQNPNQFKTLLLSRIYDDVLVNLCSAPCFPVCLGKCLSTRSGPKIPSLPSQSIFHRPPLLKSLPHWSTARAVSQRHKNSPCLQPWGTCDTGHVLYDPSSLGDSWPLRAWVLALESLCFTHTF